MVVCGPAKPSMDSCGRLLRATVAHGEAIDAEDAASARQTSAIAHRHTGMNPSACDWSAS